MNNYKHILLLGFSLLLGQFTFSQANLVLNNNAYMVMNGGVFVVIENSSPNAVSTAGSGGSIISENEFNRVRWGIGNNTGSYTLPFARGSQKIPLTMNISSGGSGGNYIDFSTYGNLGWNNEIYMPSMVTHMGQLLAPNEANHSEKAIDRFWIMNPIGYTSMPTAALTFTYIDDEHTATGNTIAESKLAAQRFNTAQGTWGDMWPIGTVNTAANTVITPPVAPSDYFPAWTLSQIDDPLPVQLLSFNASCNELYADINWETATETNSAYFSVYRSIDGNTWEEVCTKEAQGYATMVTPYHCSVELKRGQINYFKLVQVDFDGAEMSYGPISLSCGEALSEFIVYPNPANHQFTVQVNLPTAENAEINLLDVTGKLVAKREVLLKAGVSQVLFDSDDYAKGTYVVQIISETTFLPKKIIISH